MADSSRKNHAFFDETFAIATFYRPIGYRDNLISSLHVIGDGVAVANVTVEHTDLVMNLDGTAVDPTVAGGTGVWIQDTAIGTLAVTAGAPGARTSFGNQARRMSRAKLVVTTGGRIAGWGSGLG